VDREGLRVVPEAAPGLEPESAQPAEQGTVQAPARRGTFRALRSRPFRLYFAGQVASASGSFVQQTAIGWLVLKLTGSAAELGLVLAVGGVPSLLFGPWGGTVADRVGLRPLLIGTQTAYAVLAGVLWVLAVAGKTSVAFGVFLAATAGAPDIAVACLALLATGAAAFSFVTLCSTALQLHSSPNYRGRIMALWVYVYMGTTPVGSIITGAIISAAGVRAALLTGAGACLVAAAIAARVHTPPHADAALTDLASA